MIRKKRIIFSSVILIIVGIIAVLLGFFAYQLGLDNNDILGNKRKLLICLGFFTIFSPLLLFIGKKIQQRFIQCQSNLTQNITKSRFYNWINKKKFQFQNNRFSLFIQKHTWILGCLSCLSIIFIAIWYLTSGTFTQWIPYSSYYDKQADAFLSGQLSLLEEPPIEFQKIENIYQWQNRVEIPYLWDASYYKGKYFLYWGPIPAIITTIIKLFHPGVVEDQILVLLFFSGFAIMLSFLFCWLHKSYFSNTPVWTIPLFTFAGSLCTPIFWLVNNPNVYSAAIISGQFFLLLGLYSSLRALSESRFSNGWLLLASIGFGCAVGSRFSYVFTIIVLCMIIGLALIMRYKFRVSLVPPLLSFIIPIAVIALGLAWFNYARFGSIFETGLSFQLTGDALPDDLNKLFLPGYIIPNTYLSFLRPFKFSGKEFPFFYTPPIFDNTWPSWIHRPSTYYSGEPVVGVLVSMPFLWLITIPLFVLGKKLINWIIETPELKTNTSKLRIPNWFLILILGGLISQFLTIMSFVMTTMRYLADFVTLLIILATLIIWISFNFIYKTFWKKLYSIIIIVFCSMTIVIGLLTNFQNGNRRFQNNNPTLYGEIADFFNKD